MQELLPAAADDVLGEKHRDGVTGAVDLGALYVFQDRGCNCTLRVVEDREGDAQIILDQSPLGWFGVRRTP